MLQNGLVSIPVPANEEPRRFLPGSAETLALKAELERQRCAAAEYCLMIDREEVYADEVLPLRLPHDKAAAFASYHRAGAAELDMALESVQGDMHVWSSIPWQNRAGFMMKCAEHIKARYRDQIAAALMLGTGRTVTEAEAEVCGALDALRFSAYFLYELCGLQPAVTGGKYLNRQEFRALDDFVAVISDCGSLASAISQVAALLATGNHMIWNPAPELAPALSIFVRALMDMGLPAGGLCFVPSEKGVFAEKVLTHEALGGVSFTGELEDFEAVWRIVGANISGYKSFPVIQGDVFSTNFVFMHHCASEDTDPLVSGLVRGAFGFGGQKMDSTSIAMVPTRQMPDVAGKIKAALQKLKMGDPADFANFIGAVMNEGHYDRTVACIEYCKACETAEILCGGGCDSAAGWFVEPTVVKTSDPEFKYINEFVPGPVLILFEYKSDVRDCIALMNKNKYAMNCGVYHTSRFAVSQLIRDFENMAGCMSLNERTTDRLVGQQATGGSRKSGTNSRLGGMLGLVPWVNPRSISETLLPERHVFYPCNFTQE